MTTPEAELRARVQQRDTDCAEALLHVPSALLETDHAFAEYREAKERVLDELARAANVRASVPIIQDGRRLGRELYQLSQLIADGQWALIKLQAGHFATVASEGGNALREFGA